MRNPRQLLSTTLCRARRTSAGVAQRVLLVVALASLGVAVVGCENENTVACQDYVDYFGSLQCAQGVDPGVDCNAFADYPCQVPDYFDCLRATQTCVEADLVVCNNPDLPQQGFCGGKTLAGCADLLDCAG